MLRVLTQAGVSYAPASLLTDTTIPRMFLGAVDPHTVATVTIGDIWGDTALTPTAPAYQRPVGNGWTPYENLTVRGTGTGTGPNGRLTSTVNGNSGTGNKISFAPGTFEVYDFADPTNDPVYGVYFHPQTYGIAGSGIDQTIFQLHPNSSTKASTIPAQSTGSTNQLYVMRAGPDPTSGVGPILQGFTLFATPQGHTYNGLQVYAGVQAQLSNCKFQGMPGNNAANPGETFGLNDYQSINTTLTNCEFDGRDPVTGARVGGSNIGLNFSNGFTTTDVYTHGVGYGAGITHYKTTGTINHTRLVSQDNDIPFNCERCIGTFNLYNCTFTGNRSMTTSGTITQCHAVLDSDVGSAVFNVYNPTIDGGPVSASNPFVVTIHGTYGGAANKQLGSDVHIFDSHGTEQPTWKRIATNESIVYG